MGSLRFLSVHFCFCKSNLSKALCLSPSPLTFFQSPFDRARLLADSMQVPVQRGHEEQAFRKGNCAGTAKPLQKHNAKGSEQSTITSPAKH